MRDSSSLSLSSSRSAGSTFFSITDFGNEGRTLIKPLKNDCFSFAVLAGKLSRKRMVETRMLSKYSLCWNSLVVMRCAGRRARRRGSTWFARSFGMGREER